MLIPTEINSYPVTRSVEHANCATLLVPMASASMIVTFYAAKVWSFERVETEIEAAFDRISAKDATR